ncbi:MAG: hypothetical protein FWD82_07060 [Defluviitaleaceae bacterium]|nr:hypothetical protein [Defluviitaleaceae bacterium]
MDEYKKMFRIAFDFFEKHYYPSCEEDWGKIVDELECINPQNDMFLDGLLIEVINEFERIYLKESRM